MTVYHCRVEPRDTIQAHASADQLDGPASSVQIAVTAEGEFHDLFLNARDARAFAVDILAACGAIETGGSL